jgi:mannan endo-1,4-beta-mannosidase
MGGSIIIDIPGYAQETHVAADASSSIEDDDIAFSVHVYPSSYNSVTGDWLAPSDLNYLGDAGRPCLVGEFGSHRDGGADWSALVDRAKSLGWPVIGWAWNGDGSSNPMNMSSPFWGDSCGATSYSTTSYFSTIYDKLGSGGGSGGGGGGTSAHYLNAEYYSLDGVSTSTSRSGYWGDAYVTGFDNSGDSVTMSFDSVASGDRMVSIRYASPYGQKKADLSINGSFQQQVTLSETTSFTQATVGTFSFDAGTNQITIAKGWGYYDIDAVIVE